MTKKQAKARAYLLRRVARAYRPLERLTSSVVRADAKGKRRAPSMLREVERLHQAVLEIEWAVKFWRCA